MIDYAGSTQNEIANFKNFKAHTIKWYMNRLIDVESFHLCIWLTGLGFVECTLSTKIIPGQNDFEVSSNTSTPALHTNLNNPLVEYFRVVDQLDKICVK